MITDQPTGTTPLVPTADTQLATLDALRSMLAQHPNLPALAWHLKADQPGYITACIGPDASTTVDAFHALFGGYRSHSKPIIGSDGVPCTSHCWHGDAHGLNFYMFGSDPVDAFTAFTLTHNDDPQEWTDAERAEYAALAGQAAA